jgi:1-acyl-sn-glycerol-3-phosphate acyltransferase
VNLFLYFLYHFFKTLVRLAVRVFYAKITVLQAKRGQFDHPCIVVSNHPATVLDPLNTAIHIRKVVFFLANASLFKYKISAWILSRLYCIPIERLQDTGGRPLNNEASFEKATLHLTKGGCLYVAPEGTSYVWRRLRKIKTGTARIALITESKNNWKLGLSVLPVGLNYADPTQFRTHLLTIFGEPIRVADFRKDWEKDEVDAVQKLSATIAEKLSSLLLDTTDDDEDTLLNNLEIIAQNERPLPSPTHFLRSQTILTRLKDWRSDQPGAILKLTEKTKTYLDQLKAFKISDQAVSGSTTAVKAAGFAILLFPFAAMGFTSHFFPCFIVGQLAGRLNKDIHWEPTYKFLIGLVCYPLIVALQTWLVFKFSGNVWWTAVYVLSLVPTGLAAEQFLKNGKLLLEKIRWNRLLRTQPAVARDLSTYRAAILEKIADLSC